MKYDLEYGGILTLSYDVSGRSPYRSKNGIEPDSQKYLGDDWSGNLFDFFHSYKKSL